MTASISPIYKRVAFKDVVSVTKYNRIVMKRKLRLASFVDAPRLVKTFHNKPVLKNVP